MCIPPEKAILYLSQTLGRKTTDAEIAKSLGWSQEQVDKIRDISLKTIYLEDSCGSGDKDCTVADFLVDDKYENAEKTTCDKLINYQLQKDMDACLTQKESQVIRMRFGFDNGAEQTLEEVGHYFGVTRERIRQIENNAIIKLRKLYIKRGLEYSDCIGEYA